MLSGACHCGAVSFHYDKAPEFALRCNCSICRKLGAVWIYAQTEKITLISDATIKYSYGEHNIAFHSCATCGCTTHWENLKDPLGKMAVNFNLIDPENTNDIPIRNFDGAKSWAFLD